MNIDIIGTTVYANDEKVAELTDLENTSYSTKFDFIELLQNAEHASAILASYDETDANSDAEMEALQDDLETAENERNQYRSLVRKYEDYNHIEDTISTILNKVLQKTIKPAIQAYQSTYRAITQRVLCYNGLYRDETTKEWASNKHVMTFTVQPSSPINIFDKEAITTNTLAADCEAPFYKEVNDCIKNSLQQVQNESDVAGNLTHLIEEFIDQHSTLEHTISPSELVIFVSEQTPLEQLEENTYNIRYINIPKDHIYIASNQCLIIPFDTTPVIWCTITDQALVGVSVSISFDVVFKNGDVVRYTNFKGDRE